MVKFFHRLFFLCLMTLSLPVCADGLSANPWVKHNADKGGQGKNNVLEPLEEHYVSVQIPNTARDVPYIRRGGAGVIRRSVTKEEPESSFFDGLFGEDTAAAAPAKNTNSGDVFGSLFESNSSPKSSSDSGIMNELENQYKSITDGYNGTKDAVTQTIDNAKKSIDNLTSEAQNLLP